MQVTSPPFFEQPTEGCLELSFRDGSPSLFLPDTTVQKIDTIRMSLLFKEAMTKKFTCEICSSEEFKRIYDLAQDPLRLDEILTEDEKQTPWIYEDLEELITFFYPSLFQSKVTRLILEQFSHIQLDHAQEVLSIACDQPYTLALFAQKRLRQAIYFSHKEDAEQHFFAEKEVFKKYAQLKLDLKKISDEQEKKEYLKKVEEVHDHLQMLKQTFEELKHSPMGLQNASRYAEHKNIFLKNEALKAKDKLKKYIHVIREALKHCDWDIESHPLTEYLIGPKAYLLSHYGLIPVLQKETYYDSDPEDQDFYWFWNFVPGLCGSY